MTSCPSCQREIDDASRAAGRCSACGAVLRQLPQRTIADIRSAFGPKADDEELTDHGTLEAPISDTAKSAADAETIASIELSGADSDDSESMPSTIDFAGQPTMEFAGGASDPDATMVTSQWEGNIPGNVTDSRATIKQKETISGSFISSSSLIVKSRHVRPSGAAATPVTSPADAPDYELLNVIGEGGMGVVYAARQSSIARTVALKMLKNDDRNSIHREKFISEAVVTGELDHPNIVPIYDLGANDEGALFYSMKRVKGTPWNKVLKKKSLDDNLTILLRAADAVAFAHVNGVIHRDLKPENVMLGDFGEVLVMDWGLARVSPEFPNINSVSQSDAMGGTPAYMAPEMATGPLEKITTASDVYLLGAILYEIATGRPPHSGKTVMACLLSAAKNQITPAGRNGELVDIALKAMSTAPEDRHESVQAFQNAVRSYQSHSESIKLTDNAEVNLAKAAQTQDYDIYARAMYGLEESIALWPENRRASKMLATARLDYARAALAKGDYDLGASVLDPELEAHKEVLSQLQAGRRERESRKRRIRLLKGAVAALIVGVIGIIGVAYVAVSKEKNIAEANEKEARRQEGIAKVNADEAKKQEEIAEGNAEEARKQEEIAKDNAEEARNQEMIAKANAEEAKNQEEIAKDNAEEARRQEELAVNAQKAEEYESYVAQIGLAKIKIDESAFDRAAEILAESPAHLRDWEWGRLNFLTQMSERTWRGVQPVVSAVFSPDQAHFATGDWEGKATIWNIDSGKVETEILPGQLVHAVAYDKAGERLAVAGNDGFVQIYNAADGKPLAKLTGHEGPVLSVAFSPDGQWLLSGGDDKTARLWNLATSKTAQVLDRHSWWVQSVEFSPDGERIVTAGQDGRVIVWQRASADAAARRRTGVEASQEPKVFDVQVEFLQHDGPAYDATFSPDGRQVATAGYDGRVLLWNPDEVPEVDMNALIAGQSSPQSNYRVLADHQKPVRTVAFSPDGKTLASGSEDNRIIIWDVTAGEKIKELRGHASYVRSCAFSPDGTLLASAGRDGQIKLWRPEEYAETRELASDEDFRDATLSARFSANGKQIVTASRDRSASLWDARSLQREQLFREGHDFLVSCAVFFADGSRLATGAGDGTVRLWDVANGAERGLLEGVGRTGALAVSDDGALIATAGPKGEVQIWDAASGELLVDLNGDKEAGGEKTDPPPAVSALRFAGGGGLLASGDEQGRCRIWRHNAATGKWSPGAIMLGHRRAINAIAFVDNGARLITASGDNTCGQWDVATGREFKDRVLKHPEWVADMVTSRDGSLALTCCDDGRLRLWSLAEDRILQEIKTPSDKLSFTSIDMSADGRFAAAACAGDRTVRLWNLADGREITKDDGQGAEAWLQKEVGEQVWAARFAPRGNRLLVIGGNDADLFDIDTRELAVTFSPHDAVASADVSPDGARVVTGSWDSSAKIWDAATGQVIAKLEGVHAGSVNSVCFSPDGDRILTASSDGTARLWNGNDGKPREPIFRGHAGAIQYACFSPDGKRVLTASSDKTAQISDAATGKSFLTLSGHKQAVRCAEFSDDGNRVITGSDDDRAIIWEIDWEAATGKPLAVLAGHTGAVTSVALSPDGKRALTGSADNAVKLWDAVAAKEGDFAKEILTLAGHDEEVTSVSFSPDGRQALTSGRDGRTLLWPAADWTAPRNQQVSR